MTARKHKDLDLEAMRESYAAFAYGIRPDWEPAYFQEKLLAPRLERIVLNDPSWRRTIITVGFRYSKTEFCVDTFIPFYLGHHPDHPVILVTYGNDLSKKSGRVIREIMASPEYLEMFPDSRLAKHSRAAGEFETVSGGAFYAGSFTTGVNGRGAKLLVVSDPHKNPIEFASPGYMPKVQSIYDGAVKRRCEPNASILIESARWTPADLVGWLIDKDGAWDVIRDEPYTDEEQAPPREGKPLWNVIRLQAEAQVDEGWRKPHCECGLADDAGELVEHGEPLWGEHWSCADNQEQKKDPDIWDSSYLLKPTIAGGFWLAGTPPQFYEKCEPRGMNIYMICDPSRGKGSTSDRTAIGIVAAGEDRNLYLLDLVWARLDLTDRLNHLFRLHRKWQPRTVGYEEYGMQSDIDSIKKQQESENYRFVITELGRAGVWHSKSKPDRIATLKPLAVGGRLWLPSPTSPHTPADLAEKIKVFVDREWNRYPAAVHDDVLDMLARVNDPDLNLIFPMPASQQYVPRQRPAGSSWLSW